MQSKLMVPRQGWSSKEYVATFYYPVSGKQPFAFYCIVFFKSSLAPQWWFKRRHRVCYVHMGEVRNGNK